MRELFHLNMGCLSKYTGHLAVKVNGKNAYGRHACEVGDVVCFSLSFPRTLGVTGGKICLVSDEREDLLSLPLVWVCSVCGEECYEALLDTEQCGLDAGLYFCRVLLQSGLGTLCATGGNRFHFSKDGECAPCFPLTVSHFPYPAPCWIYGGGIYHIFVDRFFRGREEPVTPGATLDPNWEGGIPEYPPYPGAPLANRTFFGGDLPGVTAKLPYIASLGIRCIYLSPIFRARSNHKYDTGNYQEVDEMFGGQAALEELITAAKAFGIRVILDGVFGHTGDDSLYFNRYGTYPTLGAYQSEHSPYADWYTFRHFPDEYDAWWGIPILPQLNTAAPGCRAYFLGKEGIVARYASCGIGGMRLDVADELTDGFIQTVKQRLAEVDEQNILYGEVWEDAAVKVAYGRRCRYYQGGRLDGVMNYPLRSALIRFFRLGETAELFAYFDQILPNMPKRVADANMNLLGTHDTVRILTALGGEMPEGKSNHTLATLRMSTTQRQIALKRLKAAYLALATLPGIPTIYYGDEVGMEGYSDPFNRCPFPWGREEKSLLAFYRAVAALRRAHTIYAQGECRLLRLTPSLLVFAREEGTHVYVTLCHRGEGIYPLRLSEGMQLLTQNTVSDGVLLLSGTEGAVICAKKGDSLVLS